MSLTHHHPPKLLEISILSAQDLAPISKLLRTYAVAWVHPDQKLTTRVDHQGHTNPTWNYRFVFRVDDKFLASETSAITIEIYNVSFLRDIPIGTVRVLINNIIPPSQKNPTTMRVVSLQIRRPSSGTLHGILNLGVNLIDSTRRSMPLDSELLSASIGSSKTDDEKIKKHGSKRNNENREDEEEEEKQQKHANIIKLWRSQSERTVSDPVNEESPSKAGSERSVSILDMLKLRRKHPKSKATTTGSISSFIRPLPSEVAASMAKGLYWTPTDDVGSSIFENWTVLGDSVEVTTRPPKVVRWKTDEFATTTTTDHNLPKKNSNIGGGLLSCFGNLCGYECNIICGAPKSKKKRFGESKVYVSHPADKLRPIYR